MVILTPLSDEEASSFSPTFDQNNYTYDVFLNFRGEDTRYNFIDHLHKALLDANIVTFLDDEGLQTGDDLKPELKNAIKASRASIIVLSKNYASSTWCLEELKLILKLHKNSKHVVIPIFYHVEPTHVRKLKGSFGDSFRQHISIMEAEKDPKRRNELAQKIEQWKQALTEVSNLKGMNANGWRETKLIEEIIRDISSKISVRLQKEIPVLIGKSSLVRGITSWLRDGSTHTADILTIWGLPGIGKTSLAKYIFEMHKHGFERSSFIEDIERSSLLDSQKHLLENIQKGNLLNIHDDDECTIMIEKALLNNQTLIVLDGIDNFEKLDKLVGTKGFHPGSKIIITARDVSVTEKCGLFYMDVCPKHTKHQLVELEVDESLELLSWHAFRRKDPREGYEEESRKVVKHCAGHPLALKVLGSSLRNKDVLEWKETIVLLEEGLSPQIQEILKISFHSLPSENEKELFKHIACFFVGKDKDFTKEILKECGIKTQLGFSTLNDRSFITIGPTNKLMMHQLLQELGRDLVRQESPKKPWKRSRVWKHAESYDVLKQEKGTKKVQGLVLDMKIVENDRSADGIAGRSTKEKFGDDVHKEFDVQVLFHRVCSLFLRIWCLFAWVFQLPNSRQKNRDIKTHALSKMENLRLLQLDYVQLHGSYKHFPEGLRWLSMHGFKSSYIPLDIQMDKMVALDMSHSNLQELWKKPKLLPKLKVLNLSYSKQLVRIGGFSGLPALERLLLDRCLSLIEVSESIGQCSRMAFLDLSYCNKLKRLPQSILKLRNVRKLSIRGCTSLENFPREIKDMELLQVLDASDININTQLVVPNSIKSSVLLFPRCLVILSLRNNKLTNETLLIDFSSMSKLKALDLSRNPITSLPGFVKSLKQLELLSLEGCSSLRSVSHLPSTIIFLDASSCPLLKKIMIHPKMSRRPLINFRSSKSLIEIKGIRKMQPLAQVKEEILHSLGWDGIQQVKDQHMKVHDLITWARPKQLPLQMFYEVGIFSISFRGVEIPISLTYKSNGRSVTFTVPSSPKNPIGLNVAYLYKDSDYGSHISIYNCTKKGVWTYESYFRTLVDDYEESMVCIRHWVIEEGMMEEGDKVTVKIGEAETIGAEAIKCGISFVYGDGNDNGHPLVACHPLIYKSSKTTYRDHNSYMKWTQHVSSDSPHRFCERAASGIIDFYFKAPMKIHRQGSCRYKDGNGLSRRRFSLSGPGTRRTVQPPGTQDFEGAYFQRSSVLVYVSNQEKKSWFGLRCVLVVGSGKSKI